MTLATTVAESGQQRRAHSTSISKVSMLSARAIEEFETWLCSECPQAGASLTSSGSRALRLEALWIDDASRGQGLGTKALAGLSEICDALGVRVDALARSFDPVSGFMSPLGQEARLLEFYARQGYEQVGSCESGILLQRMPSGMNIGAPGDMQAVCEWMGVSRDALRLVERNESIDRFASQIDSMLASYAHFPDEFRRTKAVLRALKSGEPALPVFVEEGGDFIMEGRHRIVAFHLLGLESVPVITVSRKDFGNTPKL